MLRLARGLLACWRVMRARCVTGELPVCVTRVQVVTVEPAGLSPTHKLKARLLLVRGAAAWQLGEQGTADSSNGAGAVHGPLAGLRAWCQAQPASAHMPKHTQT